MAAATFTGAMQPVLEAYGAPARVCGSRVGERTRGAVAGLTDATQIPRAGAWPHVAARYAAGSATGCAAGDATGGRRRLAHKILAGLEWVDAQPRRFFVSNGLSCMGYGLPGRYWRKSGVGARPGALPDGGCRPGDVPRRAGAHHPAGHTGRHGGHERRRAGPHPRGPVARRRPPPGVQSSAIRISRKLPWPTASPPCAAQIRPNARWL